MDIPTIDAIAQKAATVLQADGGHIALIQGFLEQKVFTAGIPYLPPMKVVRFALMRDIGRRTAASHRAYGKLTDVFFIAEAWMATVKPEELKKPIGAIKDHPDRVEILIIVHFNVQEAKYAMRVYEMLRAGGTLDLVPREYPDDGQIQSDLLNNFLIGWGITPPPVPPKIDELVQ